MDAMDQFSAHLDRGWDLIQKGDSRGAALSAERALELDSESPEAYNLLGYVAALQGNFEEAIEHYSQAIALDDAYLEAMLNAAEIYIHPLGEFDEAISMCEQALELAESDDEVVDAMLLQFDALLGKNDIDAARSLSARFPEGPYEAPGHAFLVGRALYEIGDVDRAAPLIEQAVKADPHNVEAVYYSGLVLDERGDVASATAAFIRTRNLDLATPVPDWTLSTETFAVSVEQALARLPERLREHIRPGEVFVADLPGVEVLVDGVDPRATLLLDALSADPRDRDSTEPVTARLFVYQRSVERLAGSLERIEEEIYRALERELNATFYEPPPEPVSGGH